jgi:hypothetical protein
MGWAAFVPTRVGKNKPNRLSGCPLQPSRATPKPLLTDLGPSDGVHDNLKALRKTCTAWLKEIDDQSPLSLS